MIDAQNAADTPPASYAPVRDKIGPNNVPSSNYHFLHERHFWMVPLCTDCLFFLGKNAKTLLSSFTVTSSIWGYIITGSHHLCLWKRPQSLAISFHYTWGQERKQCQSLSVIHSFFCSQIQVNTIKSKILLFTSLSPDCGKQIVCGSEMTAFVMLRLQLSPVALAVGTEKSDHSEMD